MQAEVPTGRRHWNQQQSQEDAVIAPLQGVTAVAAAADTMKGTVHDAGAETLESVQQTSPPQDETDHQVDPAIVISIQPSPPSPRDREANSTEVTSTPPPSPTPRGKAEKEFENRNTSSPHKADHEPPSSSKSEDFRIPIEDDVALPPEGVPYDEDLPPPLPTGVDVVSGYDLSAVPISVDDDMPSTELLQNSREPSEVAAPSGYDNEGYVPDVPLTEIPTPEKKESQPNGICKFETEVENHSPDTPGKIAVNNVNNIATTNTAGTEAARNVITAKDNEVACNTVNQGEGTPSVNAVTEAIKENPDPSEAEKSTEGPTTVAEGGDGPRKPPRRVSFSERPPQQAVYDAGSSASPLDPAARAIKEQGLGPGEKWRILRNVTLVSTAFMLLFTAFFGAANLQSSVNPDGGLGTVSLTAVYAAIIVSNLFLPSVVIRWLGCKWAVAGCMVAFFPYAAAQLRASWASLVPTALLLGAAGAPMWCAKCSYLNAAAGAYSAVTGAPRDLVMVRFFGLFYVLFPLGHVWGNLITSEVLSTGSAEALAASANATLLVDVAAVCGANFCPAVRSAEENPNLARPPDAQIRTIGLLFIALTFAAALLVAVGVDNLRRYGEGLESPAGAEGGEGGAPPPGCAGLLVATLRLLGDRNQILLVPVTAFIGISQAFLGADFTESYIACAWGIPYIGYVLMGYGLASSLASVAVSWAVKRAGRLPVVASSIGLFLLLVAVLRWWTPQPGQGAAYVLLAAAWGLADSTALVINAMYGLLFRGREAAAYSNFSLWGSAGFIVTYSYSPHLCAQVKLGILAGILLLALAGFVAAELALRKILVAEEEAKKREQTLAGSGISVLRDKAHAA